VSVDLERSEELSQSIVRYVTRTSSVVNIDALEGRFGDDPYLLRVRPRSVLCVPLSHRGELGTLLYLENSLYSDGFSADQVRLVELLGRQAAIALANAETHRLQVESVQSRVNPHFLYNALTVVAELIATSPEQAEVVVVRLSQLYRAMVRSSANRMVTLGQELDLVRDYLELERARFGDKLGVEWAVDVDLHPARVPALLLQPLVENAVNHGVRRKVGNGKVRISASKEGSSLLISVRDDGPGWHESTGGNGFGLRSVKQRLQLLYGAGAELRIDTAAGVCVEIQLPLS
jgi:LytS/YehU family sensor histidine kinase